MASPINKVVIRILQGSAVTQTVLGELLYPPVANFIFLQRMCAINYER